MKEALTGADDVGKKKGGDEGEGDEETKEEEAIETGDVVRPAQFGRAALEAVAGVARIAVPVRTEFGVEGGAAPVTEVSVVWSFALAVIAGLHMAGGQGEVSE